MRHIHHKESATGVADLTELCKVDHARISAGARDNQLRLDLHGLLIKLVVIDAARLRADTIGDKVKIAAGHIHRGTMGQMAALCQIHTHDRIAGLEQGKINAQVCLCTRMRLHIGVLGAEQLASTVARDVFHNVNILAAAVVALAWVAPMCIRDRNTAAPPITQTLYTLVIAITPMFSP